jgi:hypothetical protein
VKKNRRFARDASPIIGKKGAEKEMNKRMVIGLALVTLLIIPASAFDFSRFDITHLNTFVNNNYVDVNQQQNQQQNQEQNQQQQQDQNQQQSQTVSIAIPQDSNGILISNRGQSRTEPSANLDIGTVTQSRYMPKGEVLVYEITPGTTVSIKAASDVGFYSIGFQPDDADKVASKDAIPSYDVTFHRMEWGTVEPVDYIDYWTMEATLPTSTEAYMVVVDNRAPNAMNTHIDIAGVNRLHSSPLIKVHTVQM